MREIARLEARYSRYLSGNLMAAINRAAAEGGSIDLDDETSDILDHACRGHVLSGGLFDVTSGVLREVWRDDIARPPTRRAIERVLARVGMDKLTWERPRLSFAVRGMEIDFGGLVKEYAADRAAEVLWLRGRSSGLVSLGGDIAVVGPLPDGSPWRVGVVDPTKRSSALATLFVERGGVATSGGYERYIQIAGRRHGHVLDPRTGWPVDGLASVTVVASNCLDAGLYATCALLRGEGGKDWLGGTTLAHLCVERAGALHGLKLAG